MMTGAAILVRRMPQRVGRTRVLVPEPMGWGRAGQAPRPVAARSQSALSPGGLPGERHPGVNITPALGPSPSKRGSPA